VLGGLSKKRVPKSLEVVTELGWRGEGQKMKMHGSNTALLALVSWIVVGCGSLQTGDAAPPPVATVPSSPTNALPSSPPPGPESPSLTPCPTGPLCWANADVTKNTFVSSWAVASQDVSADEQVWAVTRHGEIVLWDGVGLTKQFQLAGTFDDALIWGTGPDNVYAFFWRAATQGAPAHTTVVRLHDGGWDVHPSGGDYRIGALRWVDEPTLGIAAIISQAEDPSSVALVNADLSPVQRLPRLPIVDESVDACAARDLRTGALHAWILTKTGRVFAWTAGSSAWTEVTPFPVISDATELARGTGIAPNHGYYTPGLRVIRDVFKATGHVRREIATLGAGVSVKTIEPWGARTLQPDAILPHGRSVSYGVSPGSPTNNDAPLVNAGKFCSQWGWGCLADAPPAVDSLEPDGTWAYTVLPMGALPVALGASRSTRHVVGEGGALFTRPRYSDLAGGLQNAWTRHGDTGGGEIRAIDAVSDADVWVLEAVSWRTSVRHYDGRAWSERLLAPPNGSRMIVSKEGVWVVEANPPNSRMWLMKAGRWTSHPVDGTVFSFVRDRANGDLWASATGTLDSSRRYRYRWDGATWARVGDEPATWDSGAISVAGGVVWSGGVSLVRSEGGRAVLIECPASSQGYFSSVYAVADGAWAVRSELGERRLLRISGTTCTDVTPPWGPEVEVLNIDGVRDSVWVTAVRRGTLTRKEENLLFRWEGQKLEEARLALDPSFVAASVSPLGNVWVATRHGGVLRSAVPKAN